jgi:hypothetical protein
MGALEIVRRLIDDLEHAESLGHASVTVDAVLSSLRAARDELIAEQQDV